MPLAVAIISALGFLARNSQSAERTEGVAGKEDA
jgi:hypothetical protein